MSVVLRTAHIGGRAFDTAHNNDVGDAVSGNVAPGRYIKTYDADAQGGRGSVTFTDNINEAKQFSDAAAAWAFYQTQSTVKPLRPDGKPNRPLTGYHIIFEPLTAGEEEKAT